MRFFSFQSWESLAVRLLCFMSFCRTMWGSMMGFLLRSWPALVLEVLVALVVLVRVNTSLPT